MIIKIENYILKQLSKKIEKLKNDNETLKKRVILSNNESSNIFDFKF